MKVGIVGVGYVGTACANSLLHRGVCSELVLIDLPERRKHTNGVRNDLSHGASLGPPVRMNVGDYSDLADAGVVIITAGDNEKKGGATDRQDPWGRQRLLPKNAEVYRSIVPRIVARSSTVPIIVVTDPPDSLASIAREAVSVAGGSNPIISAGTFLDTRRFRIQIAEQLNCSDTSVEAYVLGEHGKTQVYAWSGARVGGVPVSKLIPSRFRSVEEFRCIVERNVIDANIDIIEATDASQHGIGRVTARIVHAILRDEGFVAPVGIWHEEFGVPLSLPSVIGKHGVRQVLPIPNPTTDDEHREQEALRASAAYIAEALQRDRDGQGFDKRPSLTWTEWCKQFKRP